MATAPPTALLGLTHAPAPSSRPPPRTTLLQATHTVVLAYTLHLRHQNVGASRSAKPDQTKKAVADGAAQEDDDSDHDFRPAADVFGADSPGLLGGVGRGADNNKQQQQQQQHHVVSETMRRFTLSASDESAVRKARLAQLREKLKREPMGTIKTSSNAGASAYAPDMGAAAGGCGSRLRRAASMAYREGNVDENGEATHY
jgi:hypothetical protein